jgi:prepilin-type N-terminal cleavage/methylation domain-containing protein
MKNLLKSKRAEGFTIIEVMIVLAIAGLIMVIVFIAVPQLQRNQRDNARQSIANRVEAEIQTYAGNNQGLYPFANTCTGAGTTGQWCDFVTRYITNKVNVNDPSSGNPVVTAANTPKAFVAAGNPAPPATSGTFLVSYGAKCNGETLQASGTATPTTHTFAVMIGLDRAGTVYCVDNG